MGDTYRPAARAWQDRFDTRRLADRLQDRFRAHWTLDEVRSFIEFVVRVTVDEVFPNCPATSTTWS